MNYGVLCAWHAARASQFEIRDGCLVEGSALARPILDGIGDAPMTICEPVKWMSMWMWMWGVGVGGVPRGAHRGAQGCR